MSDHAGSCHCGAVRFRVEGALGDASVCHCRMCQKASGNFYAALVSVRDAKLELVDRPEAGELERDFVLVNRYAVERVASDLVLGFFFPAAHFETLEGVPAG